jgi:FkbM family methyltransferase
MVFADIGANQGGFTIFAAKRLENGKVLAFEPAANIYQQLTENVQLNSFDNVVLFNFALFDKEGKADIFSEAPDPTSSIYNEGLPSLFSTHKQSIKLGETELRTLDSVLEQNRLSRLDVIKIDVEGAELMVLRGAAATLKHFKPIVIFEATPEFFSKAGYTVETVFDFLNNLGYRFHRLEQNGGLVEIQDRYLLSQCDVICLPTN